jgi:Integrase zinc binding domain
MIQRTIGRVLTMRWQQKEKGDVSKENEVIYAKHETGPTHAQLVRTTRRRGYTTVSIRHINREYSWPGTRTWITEYIKGCATCQQNKNLTHRVKTPLFRIPSAINAKPFSHIAMDLITGLPKSDGHNAILTIVDHGCSRAAIFLPCSTTITGTGIVL